MGVSRDTAQTTSLADKMKAVLLYRVVTFLVSENYIRLPRKSEAGERGSKNGERCRGCRGLPVYPSNGLFLIPCKIL